MLYGIHRGLILITPHLRHDDSLYSKHGFLFNYYELTTIIFREALVHNLVLGRINGDSYRNTIIVKLLFLHISNLSNILKISCSNITTMIGVYFDLNTGTTVVETRYFVTVIKVLPK